MNPKKEVRLLFKLAVPPLQQPCPRSWTRSSRCSACVRARTATQISSSTSRGKQPLKKNIYNSISKCLSGKHLSFACSRKSPFTGAAVCERLGLCVTPLPVAQGATAHHVQRVRFVRCALSSRTGERCCSTLHHIVLVLNRLLTDRVADLPRVCCGRPGSGRYGSQFQRLNARAEQCCKIY